jgi:DNA polymerase-3 subunit delta
MTTPKSALTAGLAQGLKPLYVIQGDEPLLQQECLDELRQSAHARGFVERVVFRVAGVRFDWSEVWSQTQSRGLFAQQQVVEIHIPSGKPGKDGGQVLTQLADMARAMRDEMVNGAAQELLLLVVLPTLDKTQRQSNWFLALERSAEVCQVQKIEPSALPAWLALRLALQGHQVKAGVQGVQTLQFFADRVEGNTLAAHQEIQKLALLYPPGELSFEQVSAAVLNVARFDVFKLSQAVLSGQFARVERMLEGLQAEGEAAVLVHYTLAEEVRVLCRIKLSLAKGQALPMALREQRVWGVREKLIERVIPHLSLSVLEHHLLAAHQLDGVVKGLKSALWPHDAWFALHQWAFSLTQSCSLAK